MKKKVIALVSVFAIVLSLAVGCSYAEKHSGNEPQTDDMVSQEVSAQQIIEQRKQNAKETGEYQTVVFAFYNWSGNLKGTERIQERMNERLREELGLEIRIVVMDSMSYTQNVRLMLSGGDKIDIFNSGALGYTECVNDGYCMDMEEDGLLEAYGTDILACISEEYMQACRINNILFGIPQMRDMAMAPGCYCIGKEYLDGIGFDYDSMYENDEIRDVIYTDYATLENIFAGLHKAYPDKTVFAAGNNLIDQGTIVDPVGGDYFGVLMDPVNSLEIENLYESELFLEKCRMMYEWNQKGYISVDNLYDDTALPEKIKTGNYMAMMSQGKPGYISQISAECGKEMIVFQVEPDIMKSNAVTNALWHIYQGSEDPIAAMQVLNLLYADEELSSLLIWGEENIDYVKTEDGHITFPEGINAENAQWYHTMNWMMPNQYISFIWEGNPIDLWEHIEAFNASSAKSKALGFTFDNSEYAAEYTALVNVYDEYVKPIMYGYVEPEAGIQEMNDELKKAGLEKYMQAKQKALDEWIAKNMQADSFE